MKADGPRLDGAATWGDRTTTTSSFIWLDASFVPKEGGSKLTNSLRLDDDRSKLTNSLPETYCTAVNANF